MANKRKHYGNTWWGNEWISAMEKIDLNENRLPRGKTYANTGKVKKVEFKSSGIVSAQVQGSDSSPYRVKIIPKPFNDGEVKKIQGIVQSYPIIVAEMNLGQLPEKLLEIIDQHSISLLPKSWNDFDASCSCPDWANPCKHLAAVFYLIANEIDKNPFLIFNLKGVRTKDLVKDSGIIIDELHFKKKITINFVSENTNTRDKDSRQDFDVFDFDFDLLDLELQFSLLNDSPHFYSQGNLKSFVVDIYSNVMKYSQSEELEELDYHFTQSNFHLIYNKKNELIKALRIPGSGTKEGLSKYKIPFWDDMTFQMSTSKQYAQNMSYEDFFDLLFHSPLSVNPSDSDSFKFLSFFSNLALSLIRSGAFVPEVYFIDDKLFNIRYIPFIDRIASMFQSQQPSYSFNLYYSPLIKDDKIKVMIQELKSIMPFALAFREHDYNVLHPNSVDELLSLLMTYYIHKILKNSPIEIPDKLLKTFFTGVPYEVENFDEGNTAQSLSNWLGKLSVQRKDIVPAIRIEEERNEDSFIEIDDLMLEIPESFKLYVDVINKKESLDPIIPLSKLFKDSGQIFNRPIKEVRTEVAQQLIFASDYLPALKDILYEKGNHIPVLELELIVELLARTTKIFNSLGIEMIIPKGLKKLALPQLRIRNESIENKSNLSYFSIENLLDFSYEIAIGDVVLSSKEFKKLIKSSNGLVKFRDQYILLKPQEVKAILERLKKPIGDYSSTDIIRAGLTGELNGLPFNADESLKHLLEELHKVDDSIVLPEGLNAKLRDYQDRGYRWLFSNMRKGFGSCLADDMGLGKTIQAICLILKLKEDQVLKKPALIVCPTTLLGNWQKECEKFAPSLNIKLYHGTNRKLTIKGIDLIVTSYGVIRRDIKKLSNKNWSVLVIDEAQNIKNPGTHQSQAVKGLSANYKIAMSGTPVENRLSELWSIFDFINHGYLNKLSQFNNQFIIPIEKHRNKQKIEMLKLATSPFILRRLKTDKSIINDLPEKVITNEYCYLTKEQAVLYQQVVNHSLKIIESADGINRRGLILQMITSLKQICNHPHQYGKKGHGYKSQSGKTEVLFSLLDNILANGEKTLIFTQYTEMGNLLRDMIAEELKTDSLFFHGSLTRKQREETLLDFQSNAKDILIISLKAGGTGLNLTQANNVIHYDLWWNPAVEDQATDRVFRIGQEKNVMVHRFITLGTFEEKIDDMIQSKRELADLTVNVGEKWITELSTKDLKSIFSLSKSQGAED